MRDELRILVRERAGGHCEYCHFPEALSFLPFQVDHIIAEKHSGATVESNLAWPCYYFNSFKGPNISGWDPDADEIVRLFHPRRDEWQHHFAWEGPTLRGLTAIGRVTVLVLDINHPDAIALRNELLDAGEQLV